MDFLTALGQDVEITVRPARKARDEVVVGEDRWGVPAQVSSQGALPELGSPAV